MFVDLRDTLDLIVKCIEFLSQSSNFHDNSQEPIWILWSICLRPKHEIGAAGGHNRHTDRRVAELGVPMRI